MVELCKEMPLDGQVTFFEAYVFATADKHIARHQSFKDVTACVIDGKKTVCLVNGPDATNIDRRKNVLSMFNKTLKNKGFDYNQIQSGQLRSLLIYFGLPDENGNINMWQGECKVILDLVQQFAADKDRIVGYMVHSNQIAQGSTELSYSHVHIIYESRKNGELQKWLFKHSSDV